MITIRKSAERGPTRIGWLDSRHTFSFGGYHDPRHMGFRALRVINDDRVAPGAGFPAHGHRDMEIITLVLDGALAHRDSMGNGARIEAGEVQYMSAGSGVTHSEFNASAERPVRFLQIWILPDVEGAPPRYGQMAIAPEAKTNRLMLALSPDGRDGAIAIRQDVRLYLTRLEPGARVTHALAPGRHGWVQAASGAARVNGHDIAEGDGVALSDLGEITLEGGGETAELLIFDLA